LLLLMLVSSISLLLLQTQFDLLKNLQDIENVSQARELSASAFQWCSEKIIASLQMNRPLSAGILFQGAYSKMQIQVDVHSPDATDPKSSLTNQYLLTAHLQKDKFNWVEQQLLHAEDKKLTVVWQREG
jgi:hypothetical protein